MKTVSMTENGEHNMGFEARSDAGYRVLSYSGSLGGGTLRVKTQLPDGGDKVPVPNSKLNATMNDAAGDLKQQLVFQAAGTIFVELTGATNPNCKVSVA